jgi:hemolysin III
MYFLDFREPVSAWTHALWMILAIPATILLCKRCGGDLSRCLSFFVFGLSLALCFAGSALFHGVQGSRSTIEIYDRLDHVGIFLLIAGSYTPIAWNLLEHRWRRWVLALAWGTAALGSTLYLAYGILPSALGTTIYLAMGWGALFCYLELTRQMSGRLLFPLMLGGVLYSVGAVINLVHWPVFWVGVFGAHELFHVLVMAASLSHYLFMLNVVIPICRAEEFTGSEVVRPATPIVSGNTSSGRPRSWLFARLQVIHVRSSYDVDHRR